MGSSIDLHIHTTASDGSDTPVELAAKVAAAGLRVFSVTDHDTVAGTKAMAGLAPAGTVFIPGVEFSCVSPAGKCHILGYGFDPDHPALAAALEEGRRLRQEKMERRLERLSEVYGITLTDEEFSWLSGQNSPGKPHLGRILLNRGLGATLDECIQVYLKKDAPGRDRIEAKTAIAAIEAAGGVSVWAHPLGGEGEKRLTADAFEAQLATLLGYGLRGMECHYSRYDLEEIRFLLSRAAGLIVTGGSDYHGANKPGLTLGMLNCQNFPSNLDMLPLTQALNMV